MTVNNKNHSPVILYPEPICLKKTGCRALQPQTPQVTPIAVPVIENTFQLTPGERVLEFKRGASILGSFLNINLLFAIIFLVCSNPIGWIFLGFAILGLIGLAISLYRNACKCQETAANATHIFCRYIVLPFLVPMLGLADRRIHENNPHGELNFCPSSHE